MSTRLCVAATSGKVVRPCLTATGQGRKGREKPCAVMESGMKPEVGWSHDQPKAEGSESEWVSPLHSPAARAAFRR